MHCLGFSLLGIYNSLARIYIECNNGLVQQFLNFNLRSLVRYLIGLLSNRFVVATTGQYLCWGCLVTVVLSFTLNQFLCLSCFTDFAANLVHSFSLLDSRVSRFSFLRAASYVLYSMPSITWRADFWTLSMSTLSDRVILECQTGTANSRTLLICFIKTSFNSSCSPSLLSVLC